MSQLQRYEQLALDEGGEIICKTAGDIITLADFLVRHGQSYGHNVQTAVGAIMKGRELGKPALWALQWIAMVRDKPTIWGAGLRALACERDYCGGIESGALTGPGAKAAIDVWGKSDNLMRRELVSNLAVRLREVGKAADQPSYWIGWAMTLHMRHGMVFVSLFDSIDARNAGLIGGRGGMYEKFPRRMFAARATGYLIRDVYPECMVGDMTAEEALDEEARPQGETIVRAEKTIANLLPAPTEEREPEKIDQREEIIDAEVQEAESEGPPEMTEDEIRHRIKVAKQSMHELGLDATAELVKLSGGKAYRDMTHHERVRFVAAIERVVSDLGASAPADGQQVPF